MADTKSPARCPFCGTEQEKIPVSSDDPDYRDPPNGMLTCKCQNQACGRVYFTVP